MSTLGLKELGQFIPALETLGGLNLKAMKRGLELTEAITSLEEHNIAEAIKKEGLKAENAYVHTYDGTHYYKGLFFGGLTLKEDYKVGYYTPVWMGCGYGLSLFETQQKLIKEKKIPDFMTPIFREFLQARGK